MKNKVIKLGLLVGLSAGLSIAVFRYQNPYLLKSFYSLLALTVLYLVFKLLFDEAAARRIKEPATRYSFRRALSTFFFISTALALITIWIEPQSLMVAYGLVGAGVAIALQDIFKNVAGGLLIFTRNNYRVGDRIEINSRQGDVIDIDLLNTTILEIGEWISGDQPTGRLCLIPNGFVLSHSVHNYTKDHEFIWDEISVPIDYDSDWRLASEIVLGLVIRETEDVTRRALQSISRLSSKYYLPERSEVPYLFIALTDNWINFTVRYITDVRTRRLLRDRLSRMILTEIERAGKERVKISSATLSITVDNKTPLANGVKKTKKGL